MHICAEIIEIDMDTMYSNLNEYADGVKNVNRIQSHMRSS